MPFNGERFEDVDRVKCEEGQYGEQVCEIRMGHPSEMHADRIETVRVAGVANDWSSDPSTSSERRKTRTSGKHLMMDYPGRCQIYKSERGDGPDNVKVLTCG